MSDDYDQENIDSIKELLKEKFEGVVQTYLKHSQIYLDKIGEGFQEQDAKKIEDNAHPLKSSSGMMGLMKVRSLSDQLEDMAVEGITDFSKEGKAHNVYTELLESALTGFKKLEAEL